VCAIVLSSWAETWGGGGGRGGEEKRERELAESLFAVG